MTMQATGYAGLTWAVVLASTLADSILIGVGVVTILVAVSTLLLRFGGFVDKRVDGRLHRKMAAGDLPTKLERQETQRTLEQLDHKLDRLLESDNR